MAKLQIVPDNAPLDNVQTELERRLKGSGVRKFQGRIFGFLEDITYKNNYDLAMILVEMNAVGSVEEGMAVFERPGSEQFCLSYPTFLGRHIRYLHFRRTENGQLYYIEK